MRRTPWRPRRGLAFKKEHDSHTNAATIRALGHALRLAPPSIPEP